MNYFIRHLPLLLLGSLSSATILQAASSVTPYLETMPVTIAWQFNVTGVGAKRVAEPVISTAAIENPGTPTERITTETSAPITYPDGNGTQKFFVQQLLRNILEGYAQSSRQLLAAAAEKQAGADAATAEATTAYENADAATIANNPTAAATFAELGDTLTAEAAAAAAEAAALKTQAEPIEEKIKTVKRNLDDTWELTAARSPQTSADGVLNSPYWIFLSKIDSTSARNLIAYDTGLRITPQYSAGTKTETFSGGRLTAASGAITTYFTLAFDSVYSDDPLYLVEFDARGLAVKGEDYDSKGSEWEVFGSGYITYNLRKTSGISGVIAPTKMKVTGSGSWYHKKFDSDAEGETIFAGTAPLNIRLGEVKYQSSAYFPEFAP